LTVDAPLLYERICNYLLTEIKRGALAPGARVPSEMELAKLFDVSRITSKKALEVLRQAGVVERIRGKGSFVARNLPDLDRLATDSPTPSPVRPRSRGGSTSAIGLVIPDLSEVYGLELFYAIEEQCALHDISLLIRRTRGHQDDEEKAIESLVTSGLVEGLLVFPVHGEYYNASLLRAILDGHAVVLIDRYLSGIAGCAVHTDNVAAAKALTEQVMERGHRHLAFVSPPPDNTSSIEARLEGFRAAFADRDPAYGGRHFLTDMRSTLPDAFTPDSVEADVQRAVAFLRAEPDITALVACEYNLARVLAKATDVLGARDRYLIACFDSPPDPVTGSAFLHVRQDQREMGRRAVELLLMQIRGEPVPKQSTVPFTVVDAGAVY
jgi:DNA-binding LacI/PurR family transcriptional regulator